MYNAFLLFMYGQTFQLHENDREDHARRLGLTLSKFDQYVRSSNTAYDIIKELGPFYGREDSNEPTFRITAEPVRLPKGSREILTQLGQDLLLLGRSLPNLPENYKAILGNDLIYSVPLTWRIDTIITEDGKLKVNEIEGQDGASALMMAEQRAYNLQKFTESTAAKLISSLEQMYLKPINGVIKIAFIRVDILNNPCSPNAERFINFMSTLSNGKVQLEHMNEVDICSGELKPDWSLYSGVISETSMSPQQLFSYGVTPDQLLSSGNYNTLVNKGIFAILFDEKLKDFWLENLGEEVYARLKNTLIPSSFINTREDLEKARKEGKVVKVFWAGTNTALINRSKGVALPHGDVEQSSDERWEFLATLLDQGVKLIAQDFVKPALIKSFLRKKGITLEPVEWYNRLCVKYVADGNPNAKEIPSVSLTAMEVTLGPDVIPAGRKCAFTAGAF
jgi:hypothetical protein